MSWTPDDILEANPVGHRQERSVLDRLLSTGQAELSVLANAASELEARPRQFVAAFFHLPYPIVVDPGWHRVEAHTLDDGMYGELAFRPFELIYSDLGDMSLREVLPHSRPNWPVITQVTALFPLWGIRARYHEKYIHHIERGTRGNPIIIPQGPSWIDNRPISLGVYETNLAKRLIRELQAVLRSFLPAYSIASLTEAPIPEWLYAYYAMTAPGRIVPSGPAVPVARALIRQSVHSMPKLQPFAPISQAMKTKFRVFGRFEAQLFAMERLRLDGEVALALIGGVSLLEWVLKAIATGTTKIKFRGLEEVSKHPSMGFFTATDISLLHLARRARNALVHEEPPTRRSLITAGAGLRSQLYQDGSHCTSEDVRALLELAFKAFREANLRGVTVVALEA